MAAEEGKNSAGFTGGRAVKETNKRGGRDFLGSPSKEMSPGSSRVSRWVPPRAYEKHATSWGDMNKKRHMANVKGK